MIVCRNYSITICFFNKFNELIRKYKGLLNKGVYLCKEDVDKRLTEDCTAVPMFCFYLNGEKIDHVNGGNMKEVEDKLINYINLYINV